MVNQTAIVRLDNTLVLLEFKCPFKRQIAKKSVPAYYKDQIQTGLALSGESVKGLERTGLSLGEKYQVASGLTWCPSINY